MTNDTTRSDEARIEDVIDIQVQAAREAAGTDEAIQAAGEDAVARDVEIEREAAPAVDPTQPVYLSTGAGPIRNFDLGGRTTIAIGDLLNEAGIRPAPGTRIYAGGALVHDLGQEVQPGELVTLAANKEAGA